MNITGYYIVDNLEQHVERKSGNDKPIACGIMFRKELLIKIGLYDENINIWEEKDLRTRFLEGNQIYNIELPLYRLHDKLKLQVDDTKKEDV